MGAGESPAGHAGQLGEKRVCENPRSAGYNSLLCEVYRGDVRLPFDDSMQALVRLASQAIFKQERSARVCGEDGSDCRLEARNAWEENQQATERWQDRSSNCEFTTFPAYLFVSVIVSSFHQLECFSSSAVKFSFEVIPTTCSRISLPLNTMTVGRPRIS